MHRESAILHWTIAVGLGFGSAGSVAFAADAAIDPPPPRGIERGDSALSAAYRQFVDAVSRGRVDEALRYFTDDAVVTATPGCTASMPCVGKAAIAESYLAALAARKAAPPLRDQRFDGKRLTTRGEVTLVIGPDGATTRLQGGHVFEFRDGRISSLRFEFDTTDTETATYLAWLAEHALAASAATR